MCYLSQQACSRAAVPRRALVLPDARVTASYLQWKPQGSAMAALLPSLPRQYPPTPKLAWLSCGQVLFAMPLESLAIGRAHIPSEKKICPLGIFMTCDTWGDCLYQERDTFITSWWLFLQSFASTLQNSYFNISLFFSWMMVVLVFKKIQVLTVCITDTSRTVSFLFLHTSSFQAYQLLQIAFQMSDNETLHCSRTTSAGTSYIHNNHKPTKGPISHHNVTLLEKVLLVLSKCLAYDNGKNTTFLLFNEII